MHTHTNVAKTQTHALKPKSTGKGTCTGCLDVLSGRQTVSNMDHKTKRRLSVMQSETAGGTVHVNDAAGGTVYQHTHTPTHTHTHSHIQAAPAMGLAAVLETDQIRRSWRRIRPARIEPAEPSR